MSARPPRGKKTDNHSPAAKLDLRRHFLRTYHPEPPRVLDCCQATGRLWKQLRTEFPVASYLGLDVVPKKGRLRCDSARVLESPGWSYDIIDVDAYGSPWAQWLAVLANSHQPVTVLLTIGCRVSKGGYMAEAMSVALGLRFRTSPPKSIMGALNETHGIPLMLGLAPARGWRIIECLEAPRGAKARYFGLRLEPPSAPLGKLSAPPRKKSSAVNN